MIFAQFWWTLLVFNSLGSSCLPMARGQQYGAQEASERLQGFNRAVNLAGPELQDLWSSFGDLPESLDQMEHPRERRNALDGMPTDKAKSPVDLAGPDLQDLGSFFGDLPQSLDQMEQPRERRNALDGLPTVQAKSPIEGSKAAAKDTRNWEAEADAWYERFQVKMAKRQANRKRMAEKTERTLVKSVTDEDMRVLGAQADAWYRDWMAQRKMNSAAQRRAGRKVGKSSGQGESSKTMEQYDQLVKRIDRSMAKPMKASEEATFQKPGQSPSLSQAKQGSPASQDNVKLRNMPQTIGQLENLQAQTCLKAKAAPESVDDTLEKLQESRNALAPLGAYHKTKSNKLDHEANYKLSKIEQEASEKIPKLPRLDYCKPKKRRSNGECDPMEEVRLKTSSRLMAKGFGPLLPSECYQLTRKGKLRDWQNHMLDATLGKNKDYDRLKDIHLQPEHFESIADLPPASAFEYKEPPYDSLYTLDQRKKPNVFDFDRPKRKPNNVEIKSKPSLRTFSHDNAFDFDRPKRKPNNVEIKSEPSLSSFSQIDQSESDQELSLKQAVGEPLAPEGQVKTNRIRSALEEEEDLNAPQQWTADSTQLSDINKETETSEYESKDTVQQQKLQQELHEDTKLHRAALAKPSAFKGRDEEQLKTDGKMLAPTINMNPEVTSWLQPNQETRARRSPRRTRRVKRSLEEHHVAARRRAQQLDDFEDHNGNRASFGMLGNGLLKPDAEAELGGEYLFFPGHELLAYNELNGSQRDPIKNLVSMMNVSSKTLYHHHEPLFGQPRKSNFKGYTDFNKLNDVQKFLQVQQNNLQFMVEVFLKNSDLLDPTKFKPKTQVAKDLLLQYQDLPLLDQLQATDLLAEDLDELLKTAGKTVHHERDVFLFKVLEGVIEEQKNTKPSSRFLNFLNAAELLKDDSEQQTWDMLAVQ